MRIVSRFNLLDEPWIKVIVNKSGDTKNVSLKDLFQNAHQYISLGGDTETQDFAVLRCLLAILHTVFSRFNQEGNIYEFEGEPLLKLDNNWKPTSTVRSTDIDEYEFLLRETWKGLWEKEQFPNIIDSYLEKWRDRFYLFDDKYPFYQVCAEDIKPEKLSKDKASEFSGKNLNRRISESANKGSLFSPKSSLNDNKEKLTESELARWLLCLHGYIGLSDKVIFGSEKYKSSKGWLFDIGGIYLEGRNLFETLLLNLVMVPSEVANIENTQVPCWELSSKEVIDRLLKGNSVNNIAEWYTNWSRAVYINPEVDLNEPFVCSIVKLPELNHINPFIEQMTIWKYNKSGDFKQTFTPKKHMYQQSVWRSFGLIASPSPSEVDKRRLPGVITWFNNIRDVTNKPILNKVVTIHAVSMMDDGNATSWVPIDEIVDTLLINELVLTDHNENGWIYRIEKGVEWTKGIIDVHYRFFVKDLKQIRNIDSDGFITAKVRDMYQQIDSEFRQWLMEIDYEDEMDSTIAKWKSILIKHVLKKAEEDIDLSNTRDLKGIIDKNNRLINALTAYNQLRVRIKNN